MSKQDRETPSSEGSQFATTHWSVVLAAGASGSADALTALETLCRAYWNPIYACVRRKGYSAEDAQDLTQQFLAGLLANGDLRRADRKKGRFRTFIRSSLDHFLVSEWRRGQAKKRGGGLTQLSVDASKAEEQYLSLPLDLLAPDVMFDRRWAMAVLEQALDRLRRTYDNQALFAEMVSLLYRDSQNDSYAEIAQRLNRTENTLKSDVYRARQNYGKMIRAVVAETVARPDQVDDELRHLLEILAQSSAGPTLP